MSQEVLWDTKNKRGSKPEKIVDYILLAEFDIDSGSTLRHQYPAEIQEYKPDWFAEHMLPEGAHNRETDYTYIFLHRTGPHIDSDYWIKPNKTPSSSSPSSEKVFLYGLNFVKTKHDSTVRRGAILKSMCIFSRYSFIEAFKKPLELALEEYFGNPSIEVLKNLFNSLNAIDISKLQYPTYLEQMLMRRGVIYDAIRQPVTDHIPSSWNKSISGQFNDIRLYLSIPVYRTPDEVGDISVTNLVKLFGEAVMRIYHAILTKQRVLFVGYNHAASDIAQMVLSSVAMVCPPMTDVIRRTFPYCTLSDLSFLEVPGYIAGVTNPMFQQRETWWDLLCVLDLPNGVGYIYSAEERKAEDKASAMANPAAGTLTLPPSSTKLNLSAAEETPHYLSDAKFIQTVISGINSRINEDWVRQQFLDYTTNILNHTQEKNALLNAAKLQEKTKKFLESNSQRMNLIEGTPEFKAMPSSNFVWASIGSDNSNTKEEKTTKNEEVDRILLKTYLRKLLNETSLDPIHEVPDFYKHFLKNLTTESSLQVLLTMLPESQGGLVPFAAGIFHSSPTVRHATAILLQRIESFPSTKAAFLTLNDFLIAAFRRQLMKIENGALLKEIQEEEEYLQKLKENEKLLALSKENPVFGTNPENPEGNKKEEDLLHQIQQPVVEITSEISSVISSAISQVTHSDVANDLTHVAEETGTVIASFLQQTLEYMATESDNTQEDQAKNNTEQSEDNSPIMDMMP